MDNYGISIYFNYQGHRIRIALPKPILWSFIVGSTKSHSLGTNAKSNYNKLASTPTFERRMKLATQRRRILDKIFPEIEQLFKLEEGLHDEIRNTEQEINNSNSIGNSNKGKEQKQ